MKQRYSILALFLITLSLVLSGCQTASVYRPPVDDPLIDGFMQVASASVSDAVDQVIGRRGFMSHDIRPLFPTKMCGRAVTVLARPANRKEPPSMALELIDTEPPGRVLVIVMDGPDGADVAAFGGIMCTGSMENGFAGAVLDGGCRDRLEIIGKGFPVYARGVVPSNSVGRYVNVAKNEPVQCGGVTVNPGDMIVGDADGVVVVPQARAWDVLNKAIELEKKEAITTEAVKKYKSIRKAAEVNNRI